MDMSPNGKQGLSSATLCPRAPFLHKLQWMGDGEESTRSREPVAHQLPVACRCGLGGAPQAQCARSATIWASGRTRDPYFEILGAPRGIMVTRSGGFEF